MHTGLRKTGSAIVIMGMLLLVLNVVINNPYCHNLVRAVLNEKIKTYTRLAVSYQAIEVKLFPPGLTLYGVAIAPRDALDAKCLEAAHISARISLISLMLGKPRLSVLELNELETAFPPERSLDQLFMLHPARDDKASPPPFEWPLTYNIPLDRLILINSKLRFSIPDQENATLPSALDIRLGGLNLDLDMADLANFSAKITIHALDLFTWGRHLARGAHLETHLEYRDNLLKSKGFQFSSQDAHGNGEFSALFEVTKVHQGNTIAYQSRNQLNGIKLDWAAKDADCDLSVLGRFLNIDETGGLVRGDVHVAVDIPLEKDKNVFWQVDGKGSAQHGRLYGFDLHESAVSYLVNEKAVAFPEIRVIKGDKVLAHGKGKIGLDDELTIDFNVSPTDILLSDLLSSLKVSGFNVIDATLSSADLRIAGKGFPFHMTVESPLVAATGIVSPLISQKTDRFAKPPSCTANLFMDINAQKLSFRHTTAKCRDNNGEQANTELTPGNQINADGDIYFAMEKGVDLRLYSSSLAASIAQYYTQIPIQGLLSTDVKIIGPYDRLAVKALIAAQNLILFHTRFREAHGSAQILPYENMVNIKDVALYAQDDGKIALAEGSIAFDDRLTSKFSGKIEALAPGMVKNIATWIHHDQAIDFGIQQGEFDLKGPLLYPLAYQGRLKVRLTNGYFNEERLFSLLDGELTNANGHWQTKNFSYDIDDLHLTFDIDHKRRHPFSWSNAANSSLLSERLGLGKDDLWHIVLGTGPFKKFSLRTRHAKQSEDQLQILPFIGAYLREADVTGRLNLAMELEGPLDHLQGHFKGEIYRLALFSSSVGPLTAEGFINGGQVDISTLTQASKSLMGRVRMEWDKEGVPFEWYLNLNRYDLRALTPAIFHQDPRNYSYISGNWRMKGEFNHFWRAACSAQIDDFKIIYSRDVEDRVQRETMFLDKPVAVTCDDGHWRITGETGATMRGSLGYIRAKTGNNVLPESLDIAIDGSAKLALMPKFLPFLDKASGAIKMAGTIRGDVHAPDMKITVNDATSQAVTEEDKESVDLSFLDFPPALRHVSFELVYQQNMVRLVKFRAEKGSSGRIQAAGIINLADNDPEHSQIQINLTQAQMNRFPVPFIKTLDSTVSGNLVLTGKDLPLKLSGVINIDRAQSYANFDIRDQILENFQKKKFSSIAMPQDPILMFDIKVLANNSVKIKNRSVNAMMATNLTLKGTDSAPVVGGNITIPEGKFTYKREFTLNQGNIVFDEMLNPPDPRLDINGSTVISNYTVSVAVTGHASDPKVSFSIDPSSRTDGSEISTKDILLLLSSGKNPNVADDANMEKELSNEALYLLVGQFEHPIERLFDLTGQTVVREVYLDVHASKDTGDPIPRVNLPINITDDANLIFQVDRDSNFRLSYEYSLNEAVSVYGSLDKAREDPSATTVTTANKEAAALSTDTEPGVDLKFRFSFP